MKERVVTPALTSLYKPNMEASDVMLNLNNRFDALNTECDGNNNLETNGEAACAELVGL